MKQQMQMFAVVGGEFVCPNTLAPNSGEAILRFLRMVGNEKYLDGGYDTMIKDGYRIAMVSLRVESLKKLKA